MSSKKRSEKPEVDSDDDAEFVAPDKEKPRKVLVQKKNEPTAREVASKSKEDTKSSSTSKSKSSSHGHHRSVSKYHHSSHRSSNHHHGGGSSHHHHSHHRSRSRSHHRHHSHRRSRSRSRSHHRHSHSRHHHSHHHDDRKSSKSKSDKKVEKKEEKVEKKEEKVEKKDEKVEKKEEKVAKKEEKVAKKEEKPVAKKEESESESESESSESESEGGNDEKGESEEGSESSGSSSSVDSDSEVLNEMKDKTLLNIYNQKDKKSMQKLFMLLGDVNGLKKEVARIGKTNFQITTDIAALEKKISLLIKNRITPEEVLEAKGAIMDVRDKVVTLPDRTQYERYGRLLYLLRTRTMYLSRLARSIKLCEMDNFLQTVMFTLYGNQYEEDEEHLLLTMFKNVLFDDFNNATAMTEILRANTPLTRMLTTYTRRDPGQQYLKQTLSSVLTEVCTDPSINLEIDPKRIFEAWVNEYEVQNGTPYEGERSPDAAEASQHQFVRQLIEERIPKLVAIIERIVGTLAQSVDLVPYGIRFICRHIKQLIMAKYPDLTMTQVCGFVGGFFMLRFINPAIATPNAHMLVEQKLSAQGRRNVTIIAKILQNLSNNVAFGGVKEAYMECLNPLMYNSWTMLNAFLDNLTKVEDLEQRLAVDQYMTFTKFMEPVVTISLNELYYMHDLLVKYKEVVFAGLKDDEVLSIINSFASVPAQVPRTENGNVEIKLVTVSKVGDNQPSVLELEQLFSEFKYQVFRLMRFLPSDAETRFKETDVIAFLKSVQEWASKSHNNDVSDLIDDIMEKMKVLLVHEILRESDNCSRLRHDFASDVLHIETRIKRMQSTVERLKEVLVQLNSAHTFAQQQMEMYRQYLDNVRVKATSVITKGADGNAVAKKVKASVKASEQPREVRFTHQQLVKDGVIISCSLSDKVISHLVYDFRQIPGNTGAYEIIPTSAKKRLDDSIIVVHLEELLERQSLSEVEYTCDPFVLQVNLLIRLINKNFLSS